MKKNGGDIVIKKKYLTILSFAIVSVLLGSLLVNNMIMAQTDDSEYDPWLDLNDDGSIDRYDFGLFAGVYGTSGKPINKKALLLELLNRVNTLNASLIELQSKVDSLNASVDELEDRVSALEEKPEGSKTIRFFEPNETIANLSAQIGAVFVWTPNNSTNNAILSFHCYFQYRSIGACMHRCMHTYFFNIDNSPPAPTSLT